MKTFEQFLTEQIKNDGGYLFHGKEHVGYMIHSSEFNTTPKKISSYFSDSKKLSNHVSSLKLPSKIHYHFIDEIKIEKKHRHKGYAQETINNLTKKPGTHLLALNAGDISHERNTHLDPSTRTKIWHKMGFHKVVDEDKNPYFFKVVKNK